MALILLVLFFILLGIIVSPWFFVGLLVLAILNL